MYFDIEQEIHKVEEISERAHEMMFDINEKLRDGLGEIPAKNVGILDSALIHLGALEGKLAELKKQLAYMHECELAFVQAINAEPSAMECYKQARNF